MKSNDLPDGHDRRIQSRRDFLAGAGAVAMGLAFGGPSAAAPATRRGIKLGFDNFAVRAMKWKAPQLLEYAAAQKVDVVLLSDLDVYESLEDAELHKLRDRAKELGVQIQAGTGSICPTSKSFNKSRGTAEEHLAFAIRVAKAVGSPVVRCVLGNGGDRQGDGGIYPHIESTVKVCKSARSLAIDSGVKIAVENHAGDMQSWELVELIQAAGKDYVGANMDSGNAIWTAEDPLESLAVIGPYAVSTSLRDSAVWETDRGAMTAWTDMGDGHVDWKAYLDRFAELCPGVAFTIETISGATRELPYLEKDFWKPYPKARAADFSRFVAMAKRGKTYQEPADRPQGQGAEAEQARQKYDLERSLNHCREQLGLGLK